jgi:hypothetical protein
MVTIAVYADALENLAEVGEIPQEDLENRRAVTAIVEDLFNDWALRARRGSQ